MAYFYKVLRAALEQELLFKDESDYERFQKKWGKDVGEVVVKSTNEDGSVNVILRRFYNQTDLLTFYDTANRVMK